MKTKFFSALICTIMLVGFTACEKEKEEPITTEIKSKIVGIWDCTHIYDDEDGTWTDISGDIFWKLQMSIRFNEDGTYYGDSYYFGKGNGTYEVKGNSILTYVDDELYMTYIVKNITNTTAELSMTAGTSSMDIRVKKR